MQRFRRSLFMLALVLAAMAMVPMVSAYENVTMIEPPPKSAAQIRAESDTRTDMIRPIAASDVINATEKTELITGLNEVWKENSSLSESTKEEILIRSETALLASRADAAASAVAPEILFALPARDHDPRTAMSSGDRQVDEIFDAAVDSEKLPSVENPDEMRAYLEEYVSPARQAIDRMKSQGYTDDQITENLRERGYGWDPATLACWKGRDPTLEEQPFIDRIRGSDYSPFRDLSDNNRRMAGFVKFSIISISSLNASRMTRVSGASNLSAGSGILFEIWPVRAGARKNITEEVRGISGKVFTSGRNASGTWSVDLDLNSWKNGEYIIIAWPENSDPLTGDQKRFFLPLNDTIMRGAGTGSVHGEIFLFPLVPSKKLSLTVSMTPEPTPQGCDVKAKEVNGMTARAIDIALSNSTIKAYLKGNWTVTEVNFLAKTAFWKDGVYVTLSTPDVMIDTNPAIVHVYVDMEKNAVNGIWDQPKRVPMPGLLANRSV